MPPCSSVLAHNDQWNLQRTFERGEDVGWLWLHPPAGVARGDLLAPAFGLLARSGALFRQRTAVGAPQLLLPRHPGRSSAPAKDFYNVFGVA